VYALKFPARPGRESRLRFPGLEGRAEVYLNGERVASHSDEHAPLTVDVSQMLRPENTLVLRFRSNAAKPDGAPESGQQRPEGSYLGPNPPLNSVGIFDQVSLESSDGTTLDEAVAGVSLDETLSTGTVTVDAAGKTRLPSVSVRVRLLDPEGKTVAESITPAEPTAGSFNCRCVVKLDRPQLWWPRGYGRQPLYRVQVTLLAGDRPQQTLAPAFRGQRCSRVRLRGQLGDAQPHEPRVGSSPHGSALRPGGTCPLQRLPHLGVGRGAARQLLRNGGCPGLSAVAGLRPVALEAG
jgi:beta-galactosidase/beta-glucuronidase